MRLWHKDLIDVLPDNQLRGQWRECCLIAKGLADGTLNHLLVNKVMQYPKSHLKRYTESVIRECRKRGIGIRELVFYAHLARWIEDESDPMVASADAPVFDGWHNFRYLRQCYYNLQEKYDCGGIGISEFMRVNEKYVKLGGRL